MAPRNVQQQSPHFRLHSAHTRLVAARPHRQRFVGLAAVQLDGNRTPDFAQDYAAAWAYWHGQDVHAPTGELLSQCWPDHDFARKTVKKIQQPHPPFATLLALPLARVDFPTARLAWCLISGVAVWAAWQVAPVKLTICLATAPIWCVALVLGTHEPLLFVLIVTAVRWWSVERPRADWVAGVALGLAIATKAYPAVLLLGLIMTRRSTALLAAGLTALVATGAAELLFGWGTTAEWLAYCGQNTLSYVLTVQNHSLVRLLYEPLRHVTWISPAVIAVALIGLLSWPLARKLKRRRSATSSHSRDAARVALGAGDTIWG